MDRGTDSWRAGSASWPWEGLSALRLPLAGTHFHQDRLVSPGSWNTAPTTPGRPLRPPSGGVAEIAMVCLVPAPQTSETTQKTRDWRFGRLSTSLQVAVTASPLASLPPASLSYPSTHQLSQGPFQPANPTMSPYSLQLPLGFLQPASQGCPPHWASAPLPTVPLNMLPPGHTKGLSHCCAFAHAIPFHWASSFKAHLKCHLLQAALPDSLVLSLGLHSTF